MPRRTSKFDKISGLVQEAIRTPTLKVGGEVTVEMIDPRTDRVIERQKSKNYINTTMFNELAKSIQKLTWTYGYQGDASTVTINPYTARDPRYMPSVRNDHIACWTDATAETAADMFAFGEVVAWAHRWQQGSPSTRQGIIVPALCTLSSTGVKWAWEWGTSQGNGTFQSVGWRRLGFNSNTGDHRIFDMPHLSRFPTTFAGYSGDLATGVSTDSQLSNGVHWLGGASYFDTASGKLYFINLATTLWKLQSVPVTIDLNGNYSIGSATDESSSAIAAGLGGDGVATATRTIYGITRIGPTGDWIGVGNTGSGTARRPTIRRVTTAGSITYTNANAATYSVESTFIDATYDGTNIWVTAVNGSTGTGAIHRIDPATGTISATISAVAAVPANFPQWTTGFSPIGIEWDAGLNCFWVSWQSTSLDGYICGIDSSGNWNGVLLAFLSNTMPIAPSSLTGQHNGRQAPSLLWYQTDDFGAQWGATNLTTGDPLASDTAFPFGQGPPSSWTSGFIAPFTTSGKGRLITIDGDVWMQTGNPPGYNSGTPAGSEKHAWAAFTDRPSFATRSLLGSPATKNNTQNMRISYTMTFS